LGVVLVLCALMLGVAVLASQAANVESSGAWHETAARLLRASRFGSVWIAHHDLFTRLRFIDPVMLRLNLLLLMAAAFLPFPTALLANYVREGGANSHVAAAVYSANMVGIGLAFAGMWAYLARRPWLLVEGIPVERVRTAFHRSLVGPIVYGLTIGLAFVSAAACFVVYALIAVYFAAGPSSRVTTPGEVTAKIDEPD
jgi:hypothetical protein